MKRHLMGPSHRIPDGGEQDANNNKLQPMKWLLNEAEDDDRSIIILVKKIFL